MEPVQINLGNTLPMPNVSFDKYQCPEVMLSVQVDMISGRRVVEQRGKVYQPKVSYDYLPNATYKAALAILRSGAPFVATVLPDNSDTPVTSTFLTDSLTPATLMGFDGGEPIWRGLAFELREERPHT